MPLVRVSGAEVPVRLRRLLFPPLLLRPLRVGSAVPAALTTTPKVEVPPKVAPAALVTVRVAPAAVVKFATPGRTVGVPVAVVIAPPRVPLPRRTPVPVRATV